MKLLTWLALVTAGAGLIAAPAPTEWKDPSPHRTEFVEVQPGVRLEVLDWGGTGRPVVLLTGSGHSAHVYDTFAPKLTDCCHVYAVTRRGFGASTQPSSGYDDQRLANDVLAVLNALHLDAPALIGHSMAGGELTTLGNQHSDRLGGLVYLDALADPRRLPEHDPGFRALLEKRPPRPPSGTCINDRTTFAAFHTYLRCRDNLQIPESELHHTFATNADGSVGRYKTPSTVSTAIGEGRVPRDYSQVRVPVLALMELPRTSLSQLRPEDPQPRNDEDRANMLALAQLTRTFVDEWVATVQRSVPTVEVVDLPGAGHYVYATREPEVLAHVRTFVARLPTARAFATVSVRRSVSEPPPGKPRWTPGGGFQGRNVTLRSLVAFAWQRHSFDERAVTGGPAWLDTDRFDVDATATEEHAPEADGTPRPSLLMLRSLLASRFGVSVHEERRERPVYALTVVTGGALGPQLRHATNDCRAIMQRGRAPVPPGQGPPCAFKTPPGRLFAQTFSMPMIASQLSRHLDRPVIDETGLVGLFDIELEAAEIKAAPDYTPGPSDLKLSRPPGTAMVVALREQLGLQLEPRTAPLRVVVVDTARPPDSTSEAAVSRPFTPRVTLEP